MKVVHYMRGTYSILLLLSASLLGAQTASPQGSGSPGGPDATMMAPVTALASYMARVEGACSTRCRWSNCCSSPTIRRQDFPECDGAAGLS